MPKARTWQEELKVIVDLMRDLSLQTDPQAAAVMYARRLRSDSLIGGDAWLSASRRKLTRPQYRITRSSRWTEAINPWKQPEKLPLFDSGLLGEVIYSNEPAVIFDLPDRVRSDDPAIEYLRGYEMLVSLPHYDGGESLNMTCTLVRDPKTFRLEQVPTMVWHGNLWGRAVNNLVLRKELEVSYEELKAAHAALDREMATIGQVQRSLLPASAPPLPGVDFAMHYTTSQRAGGDYYDFFKCNDGRHGIIVADVSGHGAPAAVLMAVTHALAQLHPGAGASPSELLGFLNTRLTERYTIGTGSFVTAFHALFDPATRKLSYASAGHPAPRIVRGRSVIPCSVKPGLPLGIEEHEEYPQSTIQLERGDTLVIFTDGITESRNPDHEMFGFERLDAALLKSCGNASVTKQAILSDLDEFCRGRMPDDDRTIVVMSI
jgi:phosphoserine phosphatase RsbU/P